MGFLSALLGVLLFLTALFLIMLVMVQRGKGGGLAGAFGGMGGQSAFGTKAGDLFTKVTIGVATFWILLCMATVKLLGLGSNPLTGDMKKVSPAPPGVSVPAEKDGAQETPVTPKPDAAPAGASATPAAPAAAPAAAPSSGPPPTKPAP